MKMEKQQVKELIDQDRGVDMKKCIVCNGKGYFKVLSKEFKVIYPEGRIPCGKCKTKGKVSK